MRIRTHPARRLRLIVLWSILLIILGTAGYFGYRFFTQSNNPIPAAISNHLSFSPFVIPKNNQHYTTDTYSVATPDKGTQVLTYKIHTKDGATVTVSQYVQPSQFTEIPEYRNKFLSDVIKQSDSTQTSNGTVYLGHINQTNAQVAVMLEKGLLVFMNPDHALDTTIWRELVNQLVIQN